MLEHAKIGLPQIDAWLAENYFKFVGFAASRGCRTPKDAVNEAWFRASFHYDPSRDYAPFFRTVLRCVIIDGFRNFYRKPPGEPLEEDHYADLASDDQDSCDDHFAAVVAALMTRLSEQSAMVLRAFFEKEIRQAELARQLGISLGALKMRLLRARAEALEILRAKGCHEFADVVGCDPASLRRAMMPSCPHPARPQPRPTCRKSPAKNL